MADTETASVARRLREELERTFGDLPRAANALGYQYASSLNSYLYGQSQIGVKMRSKLEALGIDTGYILTGRRSLPQEKVEPTIKDTRDYVERVLDEVLKETGKTYNPKARARILEKARELDSAYLRGMLEALIKGSGDAAKHEQPSDDTGRATEAHTGSGEASGGKEDER